MPLTVRSILPFCAIPLSKLNGIDTVTYSTSSASGTRAVYPPVRNIAVIIAAAPTGIANCQRFLRTAFKFLRAMNV